MDMKVVRVLWTGGPHGGKTSAIYLVRDMLERIGYSVTVVSETATEVVGGMSAKHVDAMLSAPALYAQFQKTVLLLQMEKEVQIERMVECMPATKQHVIFYDRGCYDAAAFLSGSEHAFNDILSFAEVPAFSFDTLRVKGLPAFDAVMHMQTQAACGCYNMYSEKTGTLRLHDCDSALSVDNCLLQLYASHARHFFVPACFDFEVKVSKAWQNVLATLKETQDERNERCVCL